jgi:metallo-beta-lactamase family protein
VVCAKFGRIKHHLKHNIWNPNCTILFVGYQAPGTLGERIVSGEKKVKIFGEEMAVNARIEYIEGYSGHADQQWLLNFVYSFIKRPKHIFLVHGEPNGQIVLKNKIVDSLGITVTIPSFGEEYTLDEELSMHKEFTNAIEGKQNRMRILNKIQSLEEEIENMKNIVKDDESIEDNTDKIEELDQKINTLQEKIKEIMGENQ